MMSAWLIILMDLALVIFTAKEEVVVRFNQPPIPGDLLAGSLLAPPCSA